MNEHIVEIKTQITMFMLNNTDNIKNSHWIDDTVLTLQCKYSQELGRKIENFCSDKGYTTQDLSVLLVSPHVFVISIKE